MTDQYLTETPTCNHTHPAIKETLASILADGASLADDVPNAPLSRSLVIWKHPAFRSSGST